MQENKRRERGFAVVKEEGKDREEGEHGKQRTCVILLEKGWRGEEKTG